MIPTRRAAPAQSGDRFSDKIMLDQKDGAETEDVARHGE
jgi:hypothetical protein